MIEQLDGLEYTQTFNVSDFGDSETQFEEVERYWVHRPYTYVQILYNERTGKIYNVVEPELTEEEQMLRKDIQSRLRAELRSREIHQEQEYSNFRTIPEEKEEILLSEALKVAKSYNIEKIPLHKILYHLERDLIRYGEIEPLLQDPFIEDIHCNGPLGEGNDNNVYIYHEKYEDIRTNIWFESGDELDEFVIRLAQRSGEHISSGEPVVDASLPNGARAELFLGRNVTPHGSSFTLRRFTEEPMTPPELIQTETFSLEQMAYFWLAIENNKSLVFAGETGSGKTTSMNAVSMFIPPKSRIVTIEDTREMSLPHGNWTPETTRGSVVNENEDIGIQRLLRSALRQRPEYLLVGEVRGEEASGLFQAISTGHTTYSTMHADSVDSVLERLRNEPIDLPDNQIKELDIVSIQQQIDTDSGKVRRNMKVSELTSQRGGGVRPSDVYTYQTYTGEHQQTGDPQILEEIRKQNGWTEKRINEEMEIRQEVLKYLVEHDITGYNEVVNILFGFHINRDMLVEDIEQGQLTPSDYASLQAMYDDKTNSNS